MFADTIAAAIDAAHSDTILAELSSAIWKGMAAGSIGEGEAQLLAERIHARKIARKALRDAPKPARRYVGSRPRSPASMERRRSWASSGHIPPRIAARFTMGEQAALAVIAAEVRKTGVCRLFIEHIAALAGVGRSTVKRALREASDLGLIRLEERRLTAWRNDANVVSIVDPAWSAWLRLRRGGRGPTSNCHAYEDIKPPQIRVRDDPQVGFRGRGRSGSVRRGEVRFSAGPG